MRPNVRLEDPLIAAARTVAQELRDFVVYDVEDMRQAANAIEDALDVIPPLQAKVSSLSQESEFLRAILAQVRADLTATTARELRLAEDLAGWEDGH